MPRALGDALRPSTSPPEVKVVNNLPGLYPTEDWMAYYWAVSEEGKLEEKRAVIQLPQGFSGVCPRVRIGQNGCILRVRRWGVGCYPSLLEQMGFDPSPFLTHDRRRFPGGEAQEILHLMFQATHFDLPGFFIIASNDHPFLLFDPEGDLKGSYVHWCSYLGALAYIVSGGRMAAGFLRVEREEKELYQEAVVYLLEALKEGRRAGDKGQSGERDARRAGRIV